MNEFPRDAVRTQDLLREFFPDEQWPSPEQGAEPSGADAGSAGAAGRSMVVGVPPTQTPPDGQRDHHRSPLSERQPLSKASAAVSINASIDRSTNASIEPQANAPVARRVYSPAESGAEQPAYLPIEAGRPRRTPRRLVAALLLLVAGVAVGAAGYLVGSVADGDDDGVAAEQGPAAVTTNTVAGGEGRVVAVEGADAAAVSGVEADEPPVATGAGDAAVAEEQPFIEPTPNPTSWPGYPTDPDDAPATGPYVIVKNGDFFLRGSVGTEELRQHMASFTLQLVAAENVVLEFQLDPTDPFTLDDDIPVYFDDVILFDANSELLNKDELRELALVGVTFLEANPSGAFTFTGHTDSLGSDAENLALSLRRAETVREFYISLGAPPEQMVAVGLGETEPIASNDTEAGRAENRRVEFSFTYKQ